MFLLILKINLKLTGLNLEIELAPMDTSEDNINYIENIICDTISDNCKTAVQEFQDHSGNPSVFKSFY